MSCTSELNDLMKVINTKFRAQRRILEQEKQELQAKLEQSEKRLKEREAETASVREQLLTSKKRNLELEKLVVDQNSLMQRMRSKLQVSFDNSLNGSLSEAAPRNQSGKPILEDKAVCTDDWHTILEKELTERIERFAAYMHGNKSGESRSNGHLSVISGSDASNRSHFGHNSSIRSRSDQHISNRSHSEQRSGDTSSVNRSRVENGVDENQYSLGRPTSRNGHRSDQNLHSLLENGPVQLGLAARGTSTPATSVWQASSPVSNRYSRNDQGETSNNDHSLPFDDTLRDAQNADDLDTSALQADLLQRFSELESEAHVLFDMDDPEEEAAEEEAASKHSSVENYL